MKKLILSLLLLIPSISFADTATTGNPALILISTGSVDRTRSWGDKVNENFSIISASMATLIAGGGSGSGSGGPQSSLAGSIATGPLNMNNYSIHNATNLATLDGYQIFYGSNTFMNNLTISTGNLTLVPPYPVLGIGTGFYGNPSGIRTMLESRANYTQGFVENAIRNPSTTDGTGVAYRLSNDDINAVSSRYGLTASLNSAFPSVAFIQHPTNGLHIGNAVPTAGGSPVFVKSYVNQSNVSMVGIGTAAPQALLHVISSVNFNSPLVIFSTPSNVASAGKMVEVNKSSVVFGVPIYGDGSNLTGITGSGAFDTLLASTYSYTSVSTLSVSFAQSQNLMIVAVTSAVLPTTAGQFPKVSFRFNGNNNNVYNIQGYGIDSSSITAEYLAVNGTPYFSQTFNIACKNNNSQSTKDLFITAVISSAASTTPAQSSIAGTYRDTNKITSVEMFVSWSRDGGRLGGNSDQPSYIEVYQLGGLSTSTNNGVDIYDEELMTVRRAQGINFKGDGVSVSQSGSTATVTIAGGGAVNENSTYTWTGTHNYKGRIVMQNATPIDDLTVTPNLYSLTFSPTPANGVQPAMYGFAINTGNIPAFVGHTIGVLGRSSDTENGHSYQFGVEGRADAYGDSTYRGVLAYTFGNFHRVTGSTATLYALEARSEVFDADGVTPKSTATVVSVYIPAIVGGASDRKWSIYQSGLTDPAYFGSPVGIGVQRPFGTGTKLHIGDASNPTMIIADTDNGVSFSLGASGAAGGYTFVISTTSHPLLFGVNNSEAFRVDTAKNIGINTTAPTQKLSVVGTVDVSSMMVYGTVTSTSGFVAGSTSTFNAAIIKKRVITVTDATSITPDALIADIVHQVNTQAAGTLTINNPSGTSNDGQSLLIRVKCTNAQTLSWGAAFRGGTTALPTATTGSSKYDYYSFIRNGLDSTWDFTGKAEGF